MRDVLPRLREWRTPFGLATVVGVRGSAPRPPGAVMAVAPSGEVAGSVSGGCVEAAVHEAATSVLADGVPRLETYGISDDDAFSVGLTCGGVIDVLVQRVEPDSPVLDAVSLGSPVAIATVIEGPAPLGAQRLVWRENASLSLGSPHLDAVVTADVRARLGETCTLRFGEIRVFVQSYVPPPGLLVFGAIDFASALAHVGAFLGYRVTVCDARPVFTTPQRFPDAHEVVCDWPHRFLERVDVDDRTAICVLTHDPKFDVPALTAALNTRAGYVGVMGSRRAHEDRLTRLREAGVTDEQLARLSSPIGLDLGARTPQETAISIAAEIVACRNAGSGISLSRLTGPIHRLEADQVGARPGGSTGRNHSAR